MVSAETMLSTAPPLWLHVVCACDADLEHQKVFFFWLVPTEYSEHPAVWVCYVWVWGGSNLDWIRFLSEKGFLLGGLSHKAFKGSSQEDWL